MMKLLMLLEVNGAHIGGWRHRDAAPNVMDLEKVIEIARLAERGKLDAIFLADGNGVRDMDKPELFAASSPTSRSAGFEPITLFSALSQHTKHLGFIATATTTFEQPYTLARKFLSLDHLSGGRAVWNVVTTQYEGDAYNFGSQGLSGRGDRYERAAEFVEVVKGLWDSWAEDAFIADQAAGKFLRPDRVHVLNHNGKHLNVRGPLTMPRSPQAYPIICSAGQSDQGKAFAAACSDMMFMQADSKAVALREKGDVERRLEERGRNPRQFRFIPSIAVFLGDTREAAEELFQECQSLITPAVGLEYLSSKVLHDFRGHELDAPFPEITGEVVGGTSGRRLTIELAQRENLTLRQTYQRFLAAPGGFVARGTPSDVADLMQDWYESDACDGFMLAPAIMPRSLVDIVEKLVPELQRRGLFRRDYEGRTLRENMGLKRPPHAFF